MYGTTYAEFLSLPVDVFMSLVVNWNTAVGIKSGTEVYVESAKEWGKVFRECSGSVRKKQVIEETPKWFKDALAKAKADTGKDSVTLKEVFASKK